MKSLVFAGSLATILAAVLGWLACDAVASLDLAAKRPGNANIFFVLYRLYERPHFLVAASFALGTVIWALVLKEGSARPAVVRLPVAAWAVLTIALVASFFAGLGTRLILHDYPFSMDEFAAVFQARIFASGNWEAQIPEPWRRFGFALTPVFVMIDRRHGTWQSGYLPVYAAIRALFLRADLERWTNPTLAGAAVLTLGSVVRRLWPGKPHYTVVGAILLATSPQFLMTSMTAYAMPAHLFLNLLWLLLYLEGTPRALAIAPWVGVLAFGVNNPAPHALFVAPFMLRMVRQQKWKWTAYSLGVYAAGFAGWWIWLASFNPLGRGTSSLYQFSFPISARDWLQQLMSLTLLYSWLSPAVGTLLFVGLASWRRLTEVGRDLALGIGATFTLYFCYYMGQGHGWGYRYIYNVLGNVVLLAVYGFARLDEFQWPGRFVLVGASAAVALLLQLPLRASEAREAIAPFLRARSYIRTLKGAIVSVDPSLGWYAQDLVRNDPDLANDPKLVFADRFRPKRAEVERLLPGRVHDLTREELLRLQYPVAEPRSRRRP